MTTAKRPPLARKVTPASEKKRHDELNQGIKITYKGADYEVVAGDLNGLDSKALRKELGLSFRGMLQALHDDPDIDLLAGVVWLARRVNGEQMLTYDEVASQMKYEDILEGFDIQQTQPTGETEDPEKA